MLASRYHKTPLASDGMTAAAAAILPSRYRNYVSREEEGPSTAADSCNAAKQTSSAQVEMVQQQQRRRQVSYLPTTRSHLTLAASFGVQHRT